MGMVDSAPMKLVQGLDRVLWLCNINNYSPFGVIISNQGLL